MWAIKTTSLMWAIKTESPRRMKKKADLDV